MGVSELQWSPRGRQHLPSRLVVARAAAQDGRHEVDAAHAVVDELPQELNGDVHAGRPSSNCCRIFGGTLPSTMPSLSSTCSPQNTGRSSGAPAERSYASRKAWRTPRS